MIKERYLCQFAPDGKNWITEKTSYLTNALKWLTSPEVLSFKSLIKGKVRIKNIITGAIISDK